jgi:hypothetical protein
VFDSHHNKLFLKQLIIILDIRPIPKHNLPSPLRVHREHPPIQESPIPDIRIGHTFSGPGQQGYNEFLAILRILNEDLDCGGDQLELHCRTVLLEVLDHSLDEHY